MNKWLGPRWRGLGWMLLLGLIGASPGWAQSATAIAPSRTIALWPGAAPGGNPPRGAERIGQSGSGVGAVSNIAKPRIEIYQPARPNGSAVLIIGGGGYFRIGIGNESMPTARWLAALGVTPVILYYRLPGDGWPALAPFQDGQRALRLLRAQAVELGLDPKRIGVLGFSAGGNLAGILATRFKESLYSPLDAADQGSARPDFAALIYPVISLQPPYDTTRSRRELGSQADAVQAYSVELHVSHDTPPTFLAQAADDPIANIGNSLVMFDALRKQQVPAELHVFENGGHGWGLGRPGSLVSAWPRLFAGWARAHGFLPAADGGPFAQPAAVTPAAAKDIEPDDDNGG